MSLSRSLSLSFSLCAYLIHIVFWWSTLVTPHQHDGLSESNLAQEQGQLYLNPLLPLLSLSGRAG